MWVGERQLVMKKEKSNLLIIRRTVLRTHKQTVKHGDLGPAGGPSEQKQLTILLSSAQLTRVS